MPTVPGSTPPPTAAWLAERTAFEALPENAVSVPHELMTPHPLVKATAAAVLAEVSGLERNREKLERPRKRGARPEINWAALEKPNWLDYLARGVMEIGAEVLPMRVAVESADRALRLWDALIKACEARGMRASVEGRRAKISAGTESVEMRFAEKVDQLKQSVRVGERAASARKPSGSLRIFVGETKIEDSPTRPLESQLNDVLVRIYRGLAAKRTWHAEVEKRRQEREVAAQALEEARAAQAEAAERQQIERQAKHAAQELELERERALLDEAAAWRDAAMIRGYVAHIKATTASDVAPAPLRDWLTWAATVADRLDPTLRRLTDDDGH